MTPNLIPNVDFGALLRQFQGAQGGAALDAPMNVAPPSVVTTAPVQKKKYEPSEAVTGLKELTALIEKKEKAEREARETADQARQRAYQIRMQAAQSQAPKAPGFPVRPGEGGLLAIGALLARALGVNERTVGNFLQGYVGTKATDQASLYQRRLQELQRQQQLGELEAQQQDFVANQAYREAQGYGDTANKLEMLGLQTQMGDADRREQEIRDLRKQIVTAKSTTADPRQASRQANVALAMLDNMGVDVTDLRGVVGQIQKESDEYARNLDEYNVTRKALYDAKTDPVEWESVLDRYMAVAGKLGVDVTPETFQVMSARKRELAEDIRAGKKLELAKKRADLLFTDAKIDKTDAEKAKIEEDVRKSEQYRKLMETKGPAEVQVLLARAKELRAQADAHARDAGDAKGSGAWKRFRAGQVQQYLSKFGEKIADAEAMMAQAKALLGKDPAKLNPATLRPTEKEAFGLWEAGRSQKESYTRQMDTFIGGLDDTEAGYAKSLGEAMKNPTASAPAPASYSPMGGLIGAAAQGQPATPVPTGGINPFAPTPQGATLDQIRAEALRAYDNPRLDKAKILARYKQMTGQDLFPKVSPSRR